MRDGVGIGDVGGAVIRNLHPPSFLPPLPPTATLVHVCRACGWVNYGWCALSDPRFVVGLCLNCYGKELGGKAG